MQRACAVRVSNGMLTVCGVRARRVGIGAGLRLLPLLPLVLLLLLVLVVVLLVMVVVVMVVMVRVVVLDS